MELAKWPITIDEDYVQSEAKEQFDRELSEEEYEEVYYALLDNLCEFTRDAMIDVVDFHEMLERNKGAEKAFPHFVVYHRNINAYQPEFKRGQAFTNEADAKEYIHYDYVSEFDEWRVMQVDRDGAEVEVYRVN